VTETFDHVLVGSGGGSMCAALVARDAGQTAVILEKQQIVGGSTGLSGGALWLPNNPLLQREGIADSYDRARTYLDAAVTHDGPGSSPERREAYLRTSPELVRYLESKGMRFVYSDGWSDYYDELPGGEPRGRTLAAELFDINELGPWKDRLAVFRGPPIRLYTHELGAVILLRRNWQARRQALRIGARVASQLVRGRDCRGAGAALQGRMLQLVLRAGVPVRTGAQVVTLQTDGSRVTGVVVERDGQRHVIQARRSVLLNCGGFARNRAMRERFGPHPVSDQWTAANDGDTGEVIEMAVGLGAATDCMDEAWWALTSRTLDGKLPEGARTKDGQPAPFQHHFDISLPHSIVVDQDGRRFANEAASYMEVGQRLYERQQETGRAVPAWAILESRHRNRYLWGTELRARAPRSWFDSGYMRRADTLTELARQCGISPEGLAATVSRFNQFARDGVDEDHRRGARHFDRYHGDPTVKPNPNLGAIEQPPFYAVALYPGDVGTAGGLVTDADGRVLAEDGTAIDGLFATGNTTASVMGRTYPGAGASIAAAYIFGYRAALAAATQPPDATAATQPNRTAET
jgi:3-oxosteroid 1-dehydrogenase